MLRLDWNLLFTIINVIVLFLILKKFLIVPVMGVIEKRGALIEEQFSNAHKAETEALSLKKGYEESVQNVKQITDEMLENAQKNADRNYESIVNEANEKAGRILLDAEKQIQIEREKALRDVQAEIGGLAVVAATKMVADSLESGKSAYAGFLKKVGDSYDATSN